MKDIIERVAPLDHESRLYIIDRAKEYELEISHLKAQYEKLSARLSNMNSTQYTLITRAKREISVALNRYKQCTVFFSRFRNRFVVLTQDARINKESLSANSVLVCTYSKSSSLIDIENDLYQTMAEL